MRVPLWLTRVESASMEPTLRSGALALTRALRPGTCLRRGDLVVADSAELGRRIVKRIIGLPGKRVTFHGGIVRIDGRPLREPYAAPSLYRGEFSVPAGHYFLLGDNRDASSDSRSWQRPYLSRREIAGRLVGRDSAVFNPRNSRARGGRHHLGRARLLPRDGSRDGSWADPDRFRISDLGRQLWGGY